MCVQDVPLALAEAGGMVVAAVDDALHIYDPATARCAALGPAACSTRSACVGGRMWALLTRTRTPGPARPAQGEGLE